MKNLTIWGKNRIVFIITHRLSTIRSADQIAFLNKGKIVEAGTHIQLMAQLGPYSDFVTAELGNTPTEKNYE
jgi:ATP-binding cassette subfamily B protein